MKAKRILSAILCLIMALALLPTTAFAADDPIIIGGVGLNETNCYYVNGANGAPGTVSATEPTMGWNAHYYIDSTNPPLSTPTLELNGLVLTDYNGQDGIYAKDDSTYSYLTLVLSGDSRVSTSYDGDGYGLYVDLPYLTVKGSGSLDAAHNGNSNSGYGVLAESLTMQSGKLSGTGNSFGIYCTNAFETRDGEVTAVGHGEAALRANSASISDGSVVAGGGTGIAPTAGIETEFTCEISGGKVEARGRDYGIQASSGENITISGGTVLATGGTQALKTTGSGSLDLSGYTTPHAITVSTDASGSPVATYVAGNIANYKYFRIGPPPVAVDGLGMTATATESSYYVNGIGDNQGTVYTTEPSNWNAKLELVGGEYKLTIKDLSIERSDSNSGIKSTVDLNLHLGVGTRNSTVIVRTGTEPAVDVTGDLTVTGDGSTVTITAISHVGDGIHVSGNITLSGGINGAAGQTVKAGCCGIYAGGNLLIESGTGAINGSAFRNTDESSRGIKAIGNVVMNGNSLTADAETYGIGLEAGGGITLNNGSIWLDGGTRAMNKAPDTDGYRFYTWSIREDGYIYTYYKPYVYDTEDTSVEIKTATGATISDGTVSGTTGAAITPVDVAVEIENDWFYLISAGEDVTSWFTNIPAGITATLKEEVEDSDQIAEVSFSGTPTAASTAAMAATLPETVLYEADMDIPVEVNVNAKWAITSSTPPGPSAPTYDAALITSGAVYNADRTVWLTGSGLPSGDVLITEHDPQGSAYQALLKLANGDDVFGTYNIYLQSGRKSTGSAMYLHFALGAKYAGQAFTLVHQKANEAYEYFYATADANGELTFGPLYELSPFMLVRGTLLQAPLTGVASVPNTGNRSQPMRWFALVLLVAAASAAVTVLGKRRQA